MTINYSNLTRDLAADFIIWDKYARHIESEKRRENWDEICDRSIAMHTDRFPFMADEIVGAFEMMRQKKVLSSMRAAQFAGRAIEQTESRIFNCAFHHITCIKDFSDFGFNLLAGSGNGFSVQSHHIDQLPMVQYLKNETRKFRIADTIEGWADSFYHLMKSAFEGSERLVFDYSEIRARGTLLKTSGGRAPGHEKLKEALERIQEVLIKAAGRKMRAIEVHDILCMFADCVASGGIRRSATISLFDMDDYEMLTCKAKHGWWEQHPYRQMANNSAVIMVDTVTYEEFNNLFKFIENSNCGEPGVHLTTTKEMGLNPCGEISLLSHQFCNLTTINMADVVDQQDFIKRCNAASLIGTLQASYTDFHYLSPKWKRQTEKEALIGVSHTGIGNNLAVWEKSDLRAGALAVLAENARVAAKLGINLAARATTGKPEGTGSIALGMVTSGIHNGHARRFIRRFQVDFDSPLFGHLLQNGYPHLEEKLGSNGKVFFVNIPIEYDERVSTRENDGVFNMLRRAHRSVKEWIHPGHRSGENRNNQSVTLYVKEGEWQGVCDWVWEHKHDFTGLSFLPFDGGTYTQTPFETIDETRYNKMIKDLDGFSYDLTKIVELEDGTAQQMAAACAGGACEIP